MASHATGDGGIPPRDAGARGLQRIMTLGGAYGTRNYTVKDLRDQKGKRVLPLRDLLGMGQKRCFEASRVRYPEFPFTD